MFDSPSVNLEEKKLFLLDNDPIVNIPVGKKPNSLPPLKADSLLVDPSITRRNPGNFHDNAGKFSFTTGSTTNKKTAARLISKCKTTTTPNDGGILQADVYEHLIKKNIDANKNKLNDFDTLCANLMHQREEERNIKKSKSLNKSSSEDSSRYEKERSANVFRRENTFEIKLSDDLDLEHSPSESVSKLISARKTHTPQSLHTEQEHPVQQERPVQRERPKTSYGRRRRTRLFTTASCL